MYITHSLTRKFHVCSTLNKLTYPGEYYGNAQVMYEMGLRRKTKKTRQM